MSERTYLDDSPADDLRDVHPEDLDLEKIPQRLWEQTLAPFHRGERSGIVLRMHDERLKAIAWDVAYDLDMAESERGIARREARGTALRRTAAPLPTNSATKSSAGWASTSLGVSYCASRPPAANTAIRSPSFTASDRS